MKTAPCTVCDIVHHVSRDTRILVGPIQPDGVAALDAGNVIVPHQGSAINQQFDSGHFPMELGVLPPAIDDLVVLDQRLRDAETANSRRAAIGDAIPPARCCDPGSEPFAVGRSVPSYALPPASIPTELTCRTLYSLR